MIVAFLFVSFWNSLFHLVPILEFLILGVNQTHLDTLARKMQ